MSKLKELLSRKYQYKCIKDVIKSFSSGLNPRQNFKLNDLNSDLYYVTVKEITSGKIVFSDKTDKINLDAWEKIQNRSKLETGDVLLSGIGTIGKVALVDIPVNNWNCSESVVLLKPNNDLITSEFLAHLLRSDYVQNQWKDQSVGSTLKGLRKDTVLNTIIPLPPLDVQKKIVSKLDKLAKMVELKESELECRKKQHSFLVKKLLLNDKYSKNKISNICKITKGKTPIQKAVPGDYPLVVTTSERKSSNGYQFDNSAVCIPLVSSRGHGIASLNHVYYQEGKFALGNILCALEVLNNLELSTKYLFYYLENTKDYTLVPLMKGGANVSLHMNDINDIEIPLPPLDVQEKIIKQLDVSLKYQEKLNAEIELRRQQYEYYRNKLLSFEEMIVNE